ncbi:hypothetical protein ACIBH1_27395 [Nonomuraea sp. NPDC050663]|uniref:hypothetical protein n=1 Tax=Nonomuraea sp. NPDC050663 TaxID=3364370 RepID=UPI003797144C
MKPLVAGSKTVVLNDPASKAAGSLPDPAMSRTLPLCSSTEWTALTGAGYDSTSHDPRGQSPVHGGSGSGRVASVVA